jgi:hypothetical protein
MHRRLAGLSILVGLTFSAGARAVEPEVTGDATGQFYDVRSPTGETVLERERVTATLGISGYDLLKPDPENRGGPELTFRARLRYDADYGANGEEVDNTNAQFFVPGFSRGPVDLMYAYVEGRRFLHGTLGFKVGRQYQTDALGWWSFDGADVKVVTPFFVAIEGYSGLEQRGGLPLSTPRFEADGVWRGNRSGFDQQGQALYPQFLDADVAPAFGVALESAGPTWLHGRLVYRRVYNTGSVAASDFASGLFAPTTFSGTRISSDRLGYAADIDLGKAAGIKGGFVYDFYDDRVTSIYGSFDAYVAKPLTLSLDYDYYAPVFDADSIWNFFAGDPLNDLGVRASLTANDHLSISAGAQARIYTVQTSSDNPTNSSPNITAAPNANYYPSNGHPFDEGGNLAARYKWGDGNVSVRGAADSGDTGERVGGDVSGERVLESRYVFRGRLGVWQWDDKLRPDRDATDFGYVLGVGYRFAPRCQAVFEWQHDINRLVGQRFRTLLTVSVAVTK